MSSSNAWAEFEGIFARIRAAFAEHEEAKTELKRLMPEDAKEAIGHGVRARRSKSGAVSFDLLNVEATHAPVQYSIAALAAALAKATSQLINPEKTQVATITEIERKGKLRAIFSLRAAVDPDWKLCAETLGQHAIAVIQTTAIDNATDTVNLTTLLAHWANGFA